MLSNIVKGYTVGHTLGRRILRNITGLPGALLDFVVAIFWGRRYLSYWNNTLPYADGTRAGILRTIWGWPGDLLGAALGTAIGVSVGVVLYIPDGVMRTIAAIQRGLKAVARNAIALVYAKTDQEPAKHGDPGPSGRLADDTLHSPTFRKKVAAYKKASWTAILFGKLKEEDPKVKLPVAKAIAKENLTPITGEDLEDGETDALIDIFTYDPLGEEIIQDEKNPLDLSKCTRRTIPTVTDAEGFTYNDYGPAATKGVRFFLRPDPEHPEAEKVNPRTRKPIKAEDLRPNPAFDNLLRLRMGKTPK
jgi:hypothetical protein